MVVKIGDDLCKAPSVRDQGGILNSDSLTPIHTQVSVHRSGHPQKPREPLLSLTDALQKNKAKCNKTRPTSYFTED